MIRNRKALATQAMIAALEVRAATNVPLWTPICIYDFVESQGVEVRFVRISSMEGMYSKSPGPVILIGDRSTGRQSFTCAHEFGHHHFGHGTRVDELTDQPDWEKPDEFLVNVFAGFLLMPKVAISQAFAQRGWALSDPTPRQMFIMAGVFGVTYSALIHHMSASLRLITSSVANRLLQIQPKAIRASILSDNEAPGVIVADAFWMGRPIDLQVGELLHAPLGTRPDGRHIRHLRTLPDGELLEATTPGISQIGSDRLSWVQFARISRRGYEGLSRYRHLEEVEDENDSAPNR